MAVTVKKEGEGEGTPEPLKLEDVQKLIDTSVNGALKAQLKRLLGGDEFKQAIAAAVKSAVAPADDDADDDADEPGERAPKPGKAGAGALAPEVKAQLDELSKANRKLQERVNAAEKARTETETKRLRDEERSVLTEALAKGGVHKDMIRPALALFGEEKRIKRGEDGAVLFAHADEDHAPEKGVGEWLKSELGQRFMPPRAAGGTGSPGAGTGGTGRAGAGQTPISDAELGQALFRLP